MLTSSRSSRGRASHQIQPTKQLDSAAQAQSPTHSYTSTNSLQANSSTIAEPSSSTTIRVKRNRIASVSDRESLQKRRRTSKEAGPPPLAIPLRSRKASNVKTLSELNSVASGPISPPGRPKFISHESQTSISSAQSQLNSPYQHPQYDQFKRIEERAQKVVKKSLNNAAALDDKRKLRSEHGSTRSKTELAQYFPAFDDMLSLAPIDPNVFSAATPMILVNDIPGFEPQPPQPDYFKASQAPYNSQVIDLEQYLPKSASKKDPLSDDVYLKAHQKAERHEKQMKNGDRERAQHEKYQLERLLEELRGPDWLKTLGISGITDTEKKRYETKRLLFIREIKALVEKFRRWKEEEKRRKIEKQQQILDDGDADQSEGTDFHGKSSTRKHTSQRTLSGLKISSRPSSKAASVRGTDRGHDFSEMDALASQQLLKEAKMATQHRRGPSHLSSTQTLPDTPPKPLTSFFEKKHIREAALSGRIRGRKIYAFGHEVPDFEEQEYKLPDHILTEDTIKSSQRNRRRRLRASSD